MYHSHVMNTRPGTLADLEIVASWITSARECEVWAGWRVRYPIDAKTLPAAIQFEDAVAVSLVDGGDRLAAFGQLIVKESQRGHLARLIVSPERRGKGFGEALVRALLDHAGAAGCGRVGLNVDCSNLPAVRLYTKLGFRDAARPDDEPESPGVRYMQRSSAADR
jgi:ribosomal protein S18 acetylase RimI-like enzyme